VSGSLQDQLRALGLASDRPDRKRKGNSGNRKAKPLKGQSGKSQAGESARGAGEREPSLDRAWALRERQEKKEADAARRRKLAEDRRRREINKAIRKIVEAHRLNREEAQIARNFMYRGRIRKLYVTAEQQAALAAGELGIVYLTGGYHLLAPEPLEAVRAIDAEHVVQLDTGGQDEEEFPVPDDITW
jgi:uncharacterized protein YaiL (DUF2058 family)